MQIPKNIQSTHVKERNECKQEHVRICVPSFVNTFTTVNAIYIFKYWLLAFHLSFLHFKHSAIYFIACFYFSKFFFKLYLQFIYKFSANLTLKQFTLNQSFDCVECFYRFINLSDLTQKIWTCFRQSYAQSICPRIY